MIDRGQEIDIETGSHYCTLISDAKTNNLINLDHEGTFILVDDGIRIRFKEHNYNPHPHPRHVFKKSRSKKSKKSKGTKKSKGIKKSKGTKKSN